MSDNKIKQEKYYQREQFTSDEKYDILKKSSGKCAHCGKPIIVGYSMTVDHFIPLFKGGSNRYINLIPLCEDCNKSKDDKLYSIDYIKYLNDKYKNEISKYLKAYLSVTDYVKRYRLLAYDEYEDYVYSINNTKFKKHNSKNIKSKYKIKLATWDDFNKLYEYFVKYLKKYNSLDSEEAARNNITFWLQFGCIYYVERNNEIYIMLAITIKHVSKYEDFRGICSQPYIYVFSYYKTELMVNTLINILYNIPKYIIKENNLKFIPLNILFIKNDSIKNSIVDYYNTKFDDETYNLFSIIRCLIGDTTDINISQDYENMSKDEKQIYNFFKNFDNITDSVINYFEKYSSTEHITWMIDSIFSYEYILYNDKLRKIAGITEDDIIRFKNINKGDGSCDETL